MRWLGAAVLLFAAGVVATDHLLGNYPLSRRGLPVFCDHLAYYTAGRLVADGRAGVVYDLAAVAKYQTELVPGWDSVEAFRNPPFAALPYVLTARLPFVASGWVWTLVGVAAYLGGLRLLNPRPPAFAVLTVPTVLCVSYGQTSLLNAGVLAVVGRLLTDRRPFAAGLVAGLLWAKPPLLLGLIVWGLLDCRRLWPAAVGCAVTGGALTAGSYLLVPEAWAGFLGTLRANAGYDAFEWWKSPGPRAFWRLLLGPGAAASALWLACAAAGVWGFVRVWQAHRDRPDVVFATAVLLTLWASPHAMIYDWALVAIPGVLLRSRAFPVGWAALAVATELGAVQAWAWGEPVVQVATPLLAWCGWRVVCQLTPKG